MKATVAFVTPFNFRWKEGGTETLRSGAKKKKIKKKELAGTVNVGGCCTGAAGDHKRGDSAT